MEKNKKLRKGLSGTFITVKWHDACDKDVQIDDFNHFKNYLGDGREMLVVNETSGRLLWVFKKVILILREKSTDGSLETTCIPRGWIIEPKELKIEEEQID